MLKGYTLGSCIWGAWDKTYRKSWGWEWCVSILENNTKNTNLKCRPCGRQAAQQQREGNTPFLATLSSGAANQHWQQQHVWQDSLSPQSTLVMCGKILQRMPNYSFHYWPTPQTPLFPLSQVTLVCKFKIHSLLITDSGNEKQGKEHVLVSIGWSVLINSPN